MLVLLKANESNESDPTNPRHAIVVIKRLCSIFCGFLCGHLKSMNGRID